MGKEKKTKRERGEAGWLFEGECLHCKTILGINKDNVWLSAWGMHLNLINADESKLKTVTQPGCGQGQKYIKTTVRFLKHFG